MTTKERLVAMVFKMGVGEEDAKAIVEAAIPRMNSDNYRVTFDRPASEYPDAMYATWWITALKPAGLEWIEKNAPFAWYRPMFE